MPPRRRAFHYNDFGIKPTTIPRDAKRQAEPPSRQGTHSHQNHFRCNPSRRLVEPHTRFAASNAHPPQPSPAPRFSRARTHPRGCSARSSRFNPWLPSSCPCRGCSRKTINYYLSSLSRRDTILLTPYKRRRCGEERRHRHPFAARESLLKMPETCSPRK